MNIKVHLPRIDKEAFNSAMASALKKASESIMEATKARYKDRHVFGPYPLPEPRYAVRRPFLARAMREAAKDMRRIVGHWRVEA